MKINYKKRFSKSYNKLDKKIQIKFDEKVIIFSQNPFDKSLNNHFLNWRYLGFRSINVTWDYRAIFREYPSWTYEFVEFVNVGTHSELYW
jgi:mRNA-degrading endonuclease YafQ of YafQ-DinJ toxin-antitoxin module